MVKKDKKIRYERVDNILLERGIVESIEEAKKLIMLGKVRSHRDQLIKKSSEKTPCNASLIIDNSKKHVSWGANKILPVFKKYRIDLNRRIGLDIGASTGGFTEVLLDFGAKKVYAVDVGKGQLDYSLRQNSKVVVLEGINARYLDSNLINDDIDVLTMDVSFISVKKILPVIDRLLSKDALGFILIKPQFELPKSEVGEGGIVKSSTAIKKCIDDITSFITNSLSWRIFDILEAPKQNLHKNQEYIFYIKK